MTSKVFEHPFDLTKVRLQSQVLDAQARFSGPLDCLVQTFRKEGVRGLYRVRVLSSYATLKFMKVVNAGSARADCWSYGRERVAVPVVQRDTTSGAVVIGHVSARRAPDAQTRDRRGRRRRNY